MHDPPDATDTAVLTYLDTVDGGAAPETIARDREWSLTTVLSRLAGLAERGLVRSHSGGVYAITDDGRAYLRGDPATVNRYRADLPNWARPRPSWMTVADVRIIDRLSATPDAVEVDTLVEALDYPSSYIVERCEELAAQGLVQPVADDAYRLRDLGNALVDGDLDPSFLEGHADVRG